jgi:hypothetical protein
MCDECIEDFELTLAELRDQDERRLQRLLDDW